MKHFSKIVAAVLSGALIFSGCSAEISSTEAKVSESASVSSEASQDFKSPGCFRSAKFGMTMSEVKEKETTLSEMSEEEIKIIYGDTSNTYLNGSFTYNNVSLDARYCFEDSALRRILISFNIPENYSEEDIVKLYNSVSNDISEINGSGVETKKIKEDNELSKYDPDKEYKTIWNTSEAKIELKRVYYSEKTNGDETTPAHYRVFLNYTDAILG